MATLAPFLVKVLLMAFPIPVPPPVTKATFPAKTIFGLCEAELKDTYLFFFQKARNQLWGQSISP
jgi:hypothetical protein